MFKRLSINILIALFIMTICAPLSYAERKPILAKVISFKGGVSIYRYKEARGIPVEKGIELMEEDRIKTGRNAFIDIAFGGGKQNIIRIEEKSELTLKSLKPKVNELGLFKGSVLSRVKKLDKKSTFSVRTPISLSGARGSGWRVARRGSKDTIEGHEGVIFAAGLDEAGKAIGEMDLSAGWKTSVEKFKRPGALAGLSGAEKDRWDAWKESLEGKKPVGKGKGIEKVSGKIEKRMEKEIGRKDDLFESADGKRINDRTDSSSNNQTKR